MQRRSFLGVVGTAGVATLAGCSDSSDSDGPNVSDEESPGDSSETLIDETIELPEDESRAYRFSSEGSVTLEYDAIVREGPAIDIIVTNETEFESYENEQSFRHSENASSLNVQNATVSAQLEEDDWVLIIDNTDMGDAQPPTNFNDDVATVEIEATIS